MPFIFVIVANKISHFLLQYNLTEDNQRSRVFSVSGEGFCLGTFLVAVHLYIFQINHEPSVPHVAVTQRNNFGDFLPLFFSFCDHLDRTELRQKKKTSLQRKKSWTISYND